MTAIFTSVYSSKFITENTEGTELESGFFLCDLCDLCGEKTLIAVGQSSKEGQPDDFQIEREARIADIF